MKPLKMKKKNRQIHRAHLVLNLS